MAETRISVTLKMPGKFDSYFSGTGIGQGQYNENNPIEVMVRNAWVNSARRKAGPGYYLIVFLEGEKETVMSALDEFMSYATDCADLNSYPDNATDRAELIAARGFIKRLQDAQKEIK